MGLANVIAIGAVSGLRSMSGPAIVSSAACNNLLRVQRTPLNWLCDNRTAFATGALALGELVADKLPNTPNRTDIGPLVVRAASGALCGAAVTLNGAGLFKKPSKNQVLLGALVGATAAVAAAYLGLNYRKKLSAHPMVSALLEDAFVGGLGAAAMKSLGPAPLTERS